MNKKKLVGGIAAVLLLGAGVAYGIGGSQSDPLISLEYLKETFQPALLQQIDSKVETSVSASYQKMVEKVTQGSSESGVGLTMKTQHRNDTVTLHQGSVILLTAGSATASVSHGELVDVTTGTASSQGMLIPGHRYLVGEGATALVTMFSDAAKLAVEGNSSIHTAGASVTPFTRSAQRCQCGCFCTQNVGDQGNAGDDSLSAGGQSFYGGEYPLYRCACWTVV